nr:hypothetical protein [Tanacetum cinerariifolium]
MRRWNLRSIIRHTTSSSDCVQITSRASNGVARKSTRAQSRGTVGVHKLGEQFDQIGQLILHVLTLSLHVSHNRIISLNNRSMVEIVSPILILIETVLIVHLIKLNILIVWNEGKTRRSNLICHHQRTIAGISLVVVNHEGLRNEFLNIVTINVAIGGWTISVRISTTTSYTTVLDRFYGSRSLVLTFLVIESKSKVRYSCNKPVVAKVSMNTPTSGISPDVAIEGVLSPAKSGLHP